MFVPFKTKCELCAPKVLQTITKKDEQVCYFCPFAVGVSVCRLCDTRRHRIGWKRRCPQRSWWTGRKDHRWNCVAEFFGVADRIGLTFSQNDLTGTWKYAGADCVFETENLLMKAGGELAAAKMESQLDNTLSKVGIRPGSCSFTFNKDNTYSAVIGNRTITGTYTLDTKNKRITMTYLNGLGTMSPSIVRNGSQISLLYEADKLLKLVSTVSALSGNSSMKTLSSLVSSYDGMLIGMQLKK